jgi:hypothetical protein
VGMLREQAKFYEEYVMKGEIEQGEEVSLCSAIQEEKEAEKRRAELVIDAQKDTLERLKSKYINFMHFIFICEKMFYCLLIQHNELIILKLYQNFR